MKRHPAPLTHLLMVLAALGSDAATQGPANVLRLYEPRNARGVRLVDANGAIVHTWPAQLSLNQGIDLQDDGSLFRSIKIEPANGVQRLAFDGTVLWDYRGPPQRVVHHDIEPLPNGNVLLLTQDRRTRAAAISRGRNPANTPNEAFVLDSIIEVQPTGATAGSIVWEWNVWDHLIQDFDPGRANFGVVADHPELVDINQPVNLLSNIEFTHLNGLDYDPIHDRIVVSSPMHGEIWVLDHGTTTAEAAGHAGGRWGKGGDLLYRWGNPAVYRAGPTSAKSLFFQHSPRFVPEGYPGAGNITVFNNRVGPASSSVDELVPPLDPAGNFILPASGRYGPAAPVWSYTSIGFHSKILSSAQRLPNGNTLICSGEQGWLFEVTQAGQTVWQHFSGAGNVFHAHHTTRSMWADAQSLSASTGGTTQFSLEAGSQHSRDSYALLGSASGIVPGFTIHGINVPLNVDGYFTSLLGAVGRGAFASWVGTLDPQGGARASYTLPPLPGLSGITLDHAFVVVDATTSRVSLASNPAPLAFLP